MRRIPVVHLIGAVQIVFVHKRVEIDLLMRVELRHSHDGGRQADCDCGIYDRPPSRAAAKLARQFQRERKRDCAPPAAARQDIHAASRKQAERRPQEEHLPPAVVDVGLQRNHRYQGQRNARHNHQPKTQLSVGENLAPMRRRPPQQRRRANRSHCQRHSGRADDEPDGYVVRRHFFGCVHFPHKQVVGGVGMLRK